MLVSIGIVHSTTSASRICFVGDTPAKIGVFTLRSSRSLDILSVLFSLFGQRFQVLKSSFQVEWEAHRIDRFPVVFITLCVENAARIRIQYIVPLPDISRRLRKQFLAWHYHGDTFASIHCLFSLSDVLRSLTTGFHRQSFEIPTSQVTLKWPTWLKKKEFWRTRPDCYARSCFLIVLPSRNTVCDTTCKEPRRVTHAMLSQPAWLSSKNCILTKLIPISLFR